MRKLFKVIDWILTVLFALLAIATLDQPFYAILFFVTALAVFPYFRKRLEENNKTGELTSNDQRGFDPDDEFVYVISNDAFESGIFKIGMTTQSPKDRVNQINSATGVPQPFLIDLVISTDKARQLESGLHDRFSGRRVNKNREFFNLGHEDIDWLIRSQNTIYVNHDHFRQKHGYEFPPKNKKAKSFFGWFKQG